MLCLSYTDVTNSYACMRTLLSIRQLHDAMMTVTAQKLYHGYEHCVHIISV